MSYLLDTNVISELIKPKVNQDLISWFHSVSSDSLYISVLTLGEIRKGIEKIKDSGKKNKLILWLEQDLADWFQGRIVNIDTQVADKWGFISATNKTLPAIDSLLAATALSHNYKLVTRNVKDFENFDGLEVVNPF